MFVPKPSDFAAVPFPRTLTAGWPKRLGHAMAGFVVATILAELVARLLGGGDLKIYRPDPVRGMAHIPGSRGWFHKEGGSFVTINRVGFRDAERPKPKPTKVFRVAVLGDSYTEALQVSREKTFCAEMERSLSSCPELEGRQVEVLNFGVSDYGLASELLTLRSRVWDFAPDVVLLAMFTANDVLDSVETLKENPRMPYFVERHGRLELDDSFRLALGDEESRPHPARERLARWLFDHSTLLQRGRQVWAEFRARRDSGQGGPGKPIAVSAMTQVYQPPSEDRWRGAWRVTEGLLRLFRNESRVRGVPFGLVVLSNPPQVHPDTRTRRDLAKALKVADLSYPDRRLRAFGAREGIPVLTVSETLRRQAERDNVFFHGFGADLGSGHYNRRGHAAIGRLIAEWLCRTIVPRSRTTRPDQAG